MKSKRHIGIAILAAAATAADMSGCGGKKANIRTAPAPSITEEHVKSGGDDALGDGMDGDPAGPKTGGNDTAAEIRLAFVDSGIRDFAQINNAMAAVTGVDPALEAVRTEYEKQLLSLPPVGNDIKAFAAAHQSAIFKLGVEYCNAMMDDAGLRSAAMPGFNFDADPAVAYSGNAKTSLAVSLMNRFWGQGLSNRPDYIAMAALVAGLIEEILADEQNLQSVPAEARTRNIAKGACAAILTALPTGVI